MRQTVHNLNHRKLETREFNRNNKLDQINKLEEELNRRKRLFQIGSDVSLP